MAELGNNSVDVIDLGKKVVIHRIEGINQPQGIEYIPGADVLVVAGAGDGAASLFSGSDFAPVWSIALGDADNANLDTETGRVVVGYGSGGLAILDPSGRTKVSKLALPGHPEGFQVSLAPQMDVRTCLIEPFSMWLGGPHAEERAHLVLPAIGFELPRHVVPAQDREDQLVTMLLARTLQRLSSVALSSFSGRSGTPWSVDPQGDPTSPTMGSGGA